MNRRFTSLNLAGIKGWVWMTSLAITILAVGIYLLASYHLQGTGFPLDDAWIHQTYARNLAYRAEWSFVPGMPSAGSTSPFWSILLTVGYLFGLAPYFWTFLLGGGCLLAISIVGEKWYRSQVTRWNTPGMWMGWFLLLEWHLVWASVSGMETTLYIFVILVTFYLLCQNRPPWLALGLLIGSSVWIRPDGLTLIGPAGWVALLSIHDWKGRQKSLVRLLLGFLIGLVPYLFFNFSLSGNLWPNTFYAKQAEYILLLQKPLWIRLLSLLVLPMIGPGIILLPGVVYAIWRAWWERQWPTVGAFLWWFGYTFLYATRLPVTYQHGRYLIPAMPVFWIMGGIGMARLISDQLKKGYWQRMIRTAWAMTLTLTLLGFYFLGAKGYAEDVAIIKTEMVRVAKWLAIETPSDSLIAAHDIGAIGYFSQRKLLDLAGLISPEVISIIRDEPSLAKYLDEKGADYLVTFPDWYPELTAKAELVFQTDSVFTRSAGYKNMCVYRWKKP